MTASRAVLTPSLKTFSRSSYPILLLFVVCARHNP